MSNRRVFNKRKLIDSLAIIIGILLMAGAVGLLIAQADFSEKQSAAHVVSAMDAIIPARKKSLPESHLGNNMPSAEIGGENFVGLLEVEQYGCVLPVGTLWNESDVSRYPMVFSGNVYNRDLVIGGSSRDDQLAFIESIEIGASVKFTDLFGRVFWYEVSMVNHADKMETIQSDEDDLTIFAKSGSTSKYVIIRCRLTNA